MSGSGREDWEQVEAIEREDSGFLDVTECGHRPGEEGGLEDKVQPEKKLAGAALKEHEDMTMLGMLDKSHHSPTTGVANNSPSINNSLASQKAATSSATMLDSLNGEFDNSQLSKEPNHQSKVNRRKDNANPGTKVQGSYWQGLDKDFMTELREAAGSSADAERGESLEL